MSWECLNMCMEFYLRISMNMYKWMHDENTCRKYIFFHFWLLNDDMKMQITFFFLLNMRMHRWIHQNYIFWSFKWKCICECIKTLSLFFYFSCMNMNLFFNEWECIKLLFLFLEFFVLIFFINIYLCMNFFKRMYLGMYEISLLFIF